MHDNDEILDNKINLFRSMEKYLNTEQIKFIEKEYSINKYSIITYVELIEVFINDKDDGFYSAIEKIIHYKNKYNVNESEIKEIIIKFTTFTML